LAVLDASASKALSTLGTAFSAPAFTALLGNSPGLTRADLKSLETGMLRGQSLPSALTKDLKSAAAFLNAAPNQPFLSSVLTGNSFGPAELNKAQQSGFYEPHATILKQSLTTFAANAARVSTPDKEFKFGLSDLKALASGTKCPNGKPLASAIPNAAEREKLVDSVRLLLDNPTVFGKLDLSGPDMAGMPNMAMKDGKFSVTDLERLIGKLPVLPNRPNFDDLVKSTLSAAPAPVSAPPIEIRDIPPARRAQMATLYQQWADTTGMVAHHEAWHGMNGPGGTKGKKTGEKFLQFHAQMRDEFVAWLGRQKPPRTDLLDKNGLLPTWDTTQPLPKEFWPGTVHHSIDWALPAFLTPTPKPGQELKLDGRTIRCLNDIKTPDELGRVWGESGAHAVAHSELDGEMGGFASVRDPAFMLWHFGVMETNRADWLKTDSGKAWQSKHPSGWTNPDADAGHVDLPKGGPIYKPQSGGKFFTADQIREAGVGFDPTDVRRAEAAARVKARPH
jgi:hypothetical protein